MARTAQTKPTVASRRRAEEEAQPLHRVLGPVRTATQRNRPPFSVGARIFTADFEDILARSFATPLAPCTTMTKATERPMAQRGIELRQRDQRHHLKPEARVERRGQPEARRDPACGEVRYHPRDFVEHEEIGKLHRREAERVEVQQHQHPERAIRQHERPVGRRDGDVGRQALGTLVHSDAPTINATSTIRCA